MKPTTLYKELSKLGQPIPPPFAIKKALRMAIVEFLSHGKPSDPQFQLASKLRNALKA